MDQAPPKVSSLELPTSSSKPPKTSFIDSKLKPHLSAASSQDKKGKGVHVWIEKVSSKSSVSSSLSSRPPPPPPELPPTSTELPQSLEPSLPASSSKSKRRNRQRKKKNRSVKKDLSSPSPSSLEPPLVICPPPPPSSPSSSGSPPLSPKVLPALRQTFSSAHSHVSDQRGKTCYSWIQKGLPNPSPSSLEPTLLSFSVPPASSPSEHSSSSSGSPPSSPEPPPTSRPDFSPPHSNAGNQQGKSNVRKGSLPIYKVPKHIKALIEKDRVPKVLNQPLSPITYKNYFATLLYVEEVYLEIWKDYQMVDVTLGDTQEETIKGQKKEKKTFITIKIDSVPERRPFLLSRDFVYARPAGSDVEPFEGILYRVKKSSHILVDFEDEFHFHHRPKHRYDISFSFNRLCFKRAHAAIQAASDSLFQNFLFPDCVPEKSIISEGRSRPSGQPFPYYERDEDQEAAVTKILDIYSSPPYIIEGQGCVIRTGKNESKPYKLSKTGEVVREAALQIYKGYPNDRILICAPLNRTCDELMISLKNVIPVCDMYRTNAAFREVEEVPDEILISCDHDGECFPCPPFADLKRFRLIFSTFVSSFRLHNEGITAGHFTHIFLVDAALATEPETMIALANFANESTAVIVTGAADQPSRIRSGMARAKGLKMSYLERLSKINHPLSPTTYKNYFAALLYSEEFYFKKWKDFLLKAVTLELYAETNKNGKKEVKTFVAFELDSVPEHRPFLLSGDLVFARPEGWTTAKPFQGLIYRVVRGKQVVVEFEDAFYSIHHPSKTYDISFSCKRVCLERARHAVKAASEALFQNFLFPDCDCDSQASNPTAPPLLSTTCHKLDQAQRSAVGHILRIEGSPPYVVTGPLCVPEGKSYAYLPEPSKAGEVVSEAVYQLFHKSPEYRILLCAPTNSCCDVLMRSLVNVIPKSTMFHAYDEVPEDILHSSPYKKKRNKIPPVEKLGQCRVILSTFMSSYRLYDKGLAAGHFSHIFLADASSAIEPETLVPLTNFADSTTTVIVTGEPANSPYWVRADIGRKKGLKISYFERLCNLRLYSTFNPMLITKLDCA